MVFGRENMLSTRKAATIIMVFVHSSQCWAKQDTPFILQNKPTQFCFNHYGVGCVELRWTSSQRIFSTLTSRCLGVQGKTVGSEVNWYDCDETSDLQQWECRNQTLLALKGQDLFIEYNNQRAGLSRDTGPTSHFTIDGGMEGACTRTYREYFTVDGNSFGRPCMFPFFYEDKWYGDCTAFGSSIKRPWCAIETKYYDHELWGYCPSTSTEHWMQNPLTKVFYQFNFQAALTWHQAHASCRQQDAHLLSITEPHDQAITIAAAIIGKTQLRLWMGLNILDQERGWQWTDGRPYRYLRWDSGHPLPDPGQDCVVIDSAEDYNWKTSVCTLLRGYICHKGVPATQLDPVPTGSCAVPWIPYNGHCYQLQRAKKTWSDALTECNKNGGNLASIHNIEEQSFVITQLGYTAADELWIGLNDKRTRLFFEWSDHTAVNYVDWEFRKPNTNPGDCVLIRGSEGQWVDSLCEEKHGYICMKKVTSQSAGEEVELHAGCKPGWRRHGSYCYLVGPETKTFEEAKERCQISDSYMVDVANGVGNAFLVSLVGMRPEKYFWLGLSNQKKVHSFVWTNSKSATFTHWNAEMPGSRQGCVAMTTGTLAGLWEVLPCTNREKYICKHLAEGVVPTLLPTTFTPPNCHPGWEHLGTRDFCFKFFPEPRLQSKLKTWFQARDFCRAIGGDLLSLHNVAEVRFGRNVVAWIGLSALDPNIGYVWSDGSPVNFLYWEDGEPNNKLNIESCVEINLGRKENGGSWNDKQCEAYNDWVCQIHAGVTPNLPPNDTVTDHNVTKDGWLVWGGNQYFINDRRMAMEDARHFCQKKHGDLVIINSAAENDFLWKQISRSYGAYYIGIMVDLDGSYEWLDGTAVVFERWDENKPALINFDETCVVMIYSMGSWTNLNCGRAHRSICKRSATAPINGTAAPAPAPKGGCPPDWHSFDLKCYKLIQTPKDTWVGARARCMKMGGNLASIASRHAQGFLITKMFGAIITDLWIGLNNMQGFVFYWADGRPKGYENWPGNKHHCTKGSYMYTPQNMGKCVSMSSSLSQFGKWCVNSCNDTLGYICQKNVDEYIEIAPTSPTPVGYIKFGNDSFKVVAKNFTWQEAERNCLEDGAHLASIRDTWSEAYLEMLTMRLQMPVWIGLNKIQTEGYFRFIDGWHLSLTQWGPGEPSRERPCVYLDVIEGWKTTYCNHTLYSVCKMSDDVPPTVPAQFPGECPEPLSLPPYGRSLAWMPFKGNCYLFMVEQYRWADAASNCLHHGAVLASIEDSTEHTFILNNLQLLKDDHEFFWIGLYKTHKGQWSWLDKTVMDFINWGEGDPNDETYGEMKCSDGTWAASSQWHFRPYICKTPKVNKQKGSVTTTESPHMKTDQRFHSGLAVAAGITIIFFAAGLVAFFYFKKAGHSRSTFANPLYISTVPPHPDTNGLMENMDSEDPELNITLS